ncbi:MAG: pyruvate dehydrogenase complex dihydrolipoamide acetyltransferase [Ferruginibacter sp.]
MAEVIRMPLLSDTMTEGKIVAWNKIVGDKVKADDVLADVETDKATMEVNGYVDGTLLYIGVPAGDAAKINQIIAIVGKEGEDYKGLLDGEGAVGNEQWAAGREQSAVDTEQSEMGKPATDNPKPATSNPQPTVVSLPDGAKEIRMPLLSDTMTEGKIVAWNKKVGDAVKADDVLADVETDKATMEVIGYEEGTLLYIGVEAGQAAKINQIIAIVGKPGTDVAAYVAAEGSATTDDKKQTTDSGPQTMVAQPATNNPQPSTNSDGRIKASPLAKKIAAEKGLDITKVQGTGDGGRIVKSDIDGYKEQSTDQRPQTTIATASLRPSTINYQPSTESYTDVPLTQMRKVIARRLGESMFTAPHFYLTMELNMDNAMAARTAINEVSPVKVSFNDMIIKACASALRLHPDVNSSWMLAPQEAGGDFIRKNNHIHIGSALALPEGLIVPVIKFADQKSLSQIAADAKELYAKAKDKKLQPAEFSGNTFTISNLGMMDIEEFTAIINPPDSCILAVGKIKEVVVSRNSKFETANVMKVTLSCDHRSVDGAVGAAFLQTLKKFLENPVRMLV